LSQFDPLSCSIVALYFKLVPLGTPLKRKPDASRRGLLGVAEAKAEDTPGEFEIALSHPEKKQQTPLIDAQNSVATHTEPATGARTSAF
jgi:hypothetical protein